MDKKTSKLDISAMEKVLWTDESKFEIFGFKRLAQRLHSNTVGFSDGLKVFWKQTGYRSCQN
jgi:hypothetical protein